MSTIIIWIIKGYQKTLSPDHGMLKARYPYGFCSFYPTCSEYAINAFSKYGVIKGFLFSVLRIVRCNPFTRPQINKI